MRPDTRFCALVGAALLSMVFVSAVAAADAPPRATAPLPGGIDWRPRCDTKPIDPACVHPRPNEHSPFAPGPHGPGSITPRECARVCSAGPTLAKDCDRCRSRATH